MDFVLSAYCFLLGFLNSVLPDWKFPDIGITYMTEFISNAKGLNVFFPIYDLMAVLSILIAFELALLSFHLMAGLISILRGGGSLTR